MASRWSAEVVALTPAACGSVVWRFGGAPRLTVIVKATFALVHGGDARLLPAEPLVRKETYVEKNPSKGVEEASELAPYLPGAGVVLTGHAHAPHGQPAPAASVRLALYRDRALLDKTLHVFGDRARSAPAAPRLFREMPLDWRRAYGGLGVADNPVGIGASLDSPALPNILDPADPSRPAGYGPISKYWPSRKQRLGGADRKLLEEGVIEVPEGFDWSYFSAAPLDQQIDLLTGDEWIVLDGMHPTLPRLQTRLPSARGEARVFAAADGRLAGRPIALVADTLAIDADRRVCSVLWRGSVGLDDPEDAARLRVFAGVGTVDTPIPWPAPDAVELPAASAPPADAAAPVSESGPLSGTVTLVRSPGRATAEPAPVAALGSTVTFAGDAESLARRPIAPFAVDPPGARSPGASIPGSPWSPEPPIRFPLEAEQDETLTMSAGGGGGGFRILMPQPPIAPPPAAPPPAPPPVVAPPARVAAPAMVEPYLMDVETGELEEIDAELIETDGDADEPLTEKAPSMKPPPRRA